MSISTHVLDTALGRPAAGVPVTLERQESGQWVTLGGGPTDADGRQKTLLGTASLDAGEYRITLGSQDFFWLRLRAARRDDGTHPQTTALPIITPAKTS